MAETGITNADTPTINPRKLPKSRNGCQQCKVRKLKCDETKPACKNCIRRGNECPGYNKILKWSTKHEVIKPPKRGRATGQRPDFVSTIPSPTSPNNARDSSPILPFPVSLTDEFPNERAAKRVRTEPASEIDPAITNAVPQLVDQDGRKEDDVVELPRSPERDILSAEESPLFNFLQDGRPRSSAIAPASPRSQSKALLRTYWRLPQATPQTGLMDTESYLVQHYFQDVCTIFSSFDSNLNPFRMSVSRIWTDCKPIKLAIQSMAAGHLANSYPQMASVGVDMQKKASESLKQELNLAIAGKAKPERSLLTLLLLGLSACWHRPNDLGLDYLKAARTLMRNKLLLEALPETKEQQRQDQFFEEALVYWEMMMGFVAPDLSEEAPVETPTKQHFPLPQEDPKRPGAPKVLPHPWTGVAPRAQIILAEVGRLVREERTTYRTKMLDLNAHLEASQRRFTLAQALEEELLAIEPPNSDSLVDVGDEKTSKRDFLIIAEATRCAALLDLYRIFSELLSKRLGPEPPTSDPSPSTSSFEEFSAFSWPFDTETVYPGNPDENTSTTPKSNIAFLNSLATHILALIETLTPQSGTRFLQLMLIVIAASELRFTSSAAPYGVNLDFFDPSSDDAKVAHARAFAEQRLEEHARRLPAKPVRRMMEIVREVWRQFDEALGVEDAELGIGLEMGAGIGGGQGVFWLDVVLDRGWETVMG